LGSLVYATDAEIEDDVQQIEEVKATYTMAVTNVATGNNAIAVTTGAADYRNIWRSRRIIVTWDPAHSLDQYMKMAYTLNDRFEIFHLPMTFITSVV
jgi:hypothetical protein